MHDAEAGTVTIAVGESFAGDIIAGAISRWHRTRPNVRINLVEGYSEYLQQRLYDGEFDFIAAGVSTFQLADGFVREPIYSANDVIVARSSHPLAGRRGLELVDLAGYTWLVPYSRQTDLSVIVEAFVAARLEPPRSVIGSDAYRIGMQLMFDNDWLLMVSPALIGTEPTSGRRALVTIAIDEPTVRRNASLVYSKTRPLTPQAASLLEEIRIAARTEQRYERPESATPGARRKATRRR
jgi:LysR family transcriptional regulator, regulator for genes of the gallate degradation pathway